MILTSRRSGILVALFAVALPFKAGGCGQTACLTVTQAQLSSGMCPTLMEAQARFIDPNCGGTIQSVDGPGAVDGTLCCYPVTARNNSFQVPFGCGTGGFPGDTTGISVSSTTGGGFGGMSNCTSCAAALQGAPFKGVCSGTSLDNLNTLRTCACATNCTTECDPTLCNAGNAPDNVCLSCLQPACAAELMACQQS